MSEENVDTVRRAYERVTADLETPRELLHPEYEVDARDVSPEGAWPRGYDASEEVLREYWGTFEDFRVEIEEVIHAGGRRGSRRRAGERERCRGVEPLLPRLDLP